MRYLLPDQKNPKATLAKVVIIEEPEMGLHPKGILDVMLNVLFLVAKGYKVILSTHSPVVLEFAWAVKILQSEIGTFEDLAELVNLPDPANVEAELTRFLEAELKTYFFDNSEGKVKVRDISSLDAGSNDPSVADWGGLSSFAERAGNLVAKVVSRNF